ncbi:glycoside hydrolase family 2 TIM barrel-domain containing protein [Actinomyces urogenitalis]|uniref:glycoside hydrolase family 2 TIM barrel-domain containing protein n=1 Tax=Actinomyces urogenitalis TaxID=103621 RepID=UPI00242EEAAE|nr:glycoside hydrolase family 2 TIM barrel-domain containing protein [Actinomyces urogenitalis]MCI7456942.1 DUF4982 domain-containing protein [Actinomyces urogenitalis]
MRRLPLNHGWTVRDNVGAFAQLMGTAPATPVTLPHDATLAAGRDPHSENATHTAYFRSGAWVYERTLDVPASWRERRVTLELEGVYRDAVVKVNGSFAAQRPNGYTMFHVELDPFLRYGQENTITVECQAHNDSRWYSGGGITRPVHLLTGPLTHIAAEGLAVTTPQIEDDLAVIEVAVPVVNGSHATATSDVTVEIHSADGGVVASGSVRVTTLAGETQLGRARMYVTNPALWSTESPVLYSAHATLWPVSDDADDAADRAETTFGIRRFQLDPLHGLRINGEVVNLRGACVHNDNGVLAGASYEAAEDRRVRLLKAAGFNALRSSHNPMSVAMLQACDRHGVLVMDETWDVWTDAKTTDDYSLSFDHWWEQDVESLVAKDRNHPSVIMYSIGNEILEIGTPFGSRRGRLIAEKVRNLDPTRYVTNSLNVMMPMLEEMAAYMAQAAQAQAAAKDGTGAEGGQDINTAMASAGDMMSQVMMMPGISEKIEESADAVDILGYNYADVRYEMEHESHPNRVIVGSETFPQRIGEYWRLVRRHPYVIGDFTWTGWDYLGEAGIARPVYHDDKPSGMGAAYPYLLAGSGDIDILGDRKTVSYYREVVFGLRTEPYLAVQRPERFDEAVAPASWTWTDSLASWTWDAEPGAPITVEAYVDAEEVAFVLNGQEVAREAVGESRPCYVKADIHYQPGTLTAVAYTGGAEVGRTSLVTAGQASQVSLMVEPQAEGVSQEGALIFVPIALTDAEGRLVPTSDRQVRVEVEGPAVLAGLGSARPSHEESFLEASCTSYDGRALAVLRPTGTGAVTVTASAEGLGKATVSVDLGR